MVRTAATVPCPLHTHLRLLASSGGALMLHYQRASDPAWQLLERLAAGLSAAAGVDRQNRALHRQRQQGLCSLQLD